MRENSRVFAMVTLLALTGALLAACQPASGIPGLGEEPTLAYFYAEW